MSRDVTLGTGLQGEASAAAAENSRRAAALRHVVTCVGGCGRQNEQDKTATPYRCPVCWKAASIAAREERR